jgi:tetratricopeptide (TPR) repeat protein
MQQTNSTIRLRRQGDLTQSTLIETGLPGHSLEDEFRSEYASFQIVDGNEKGKLEPPVEMPATVDWFEKAKTHRDKGNSVFRVSDKFREAAKEYHRALHCLRRTKRTSDAEQLRVQLYVNLAACDLNEQDYAAARKHTTKALRKDPRNVKALFRRAQARRFAAFDLDGAETDLEAALALAPSEKGIQAMLDQLRQSRAKASKKEAALAKKMFSG